MRIQPVSTVAAWAGGALVGDARVDVGPDVVIDSRKATPGSLFVALPGERVDGHDFAASAAEAGASAILATRVTDAPVPHIVVGDTVAGLSSLARGVVADATLREPGSDAASRRLVVCAITGSSGKTSTKDLLAQLLAADAPTISPVGSFNNEIGLPLTACGVTDDIRYLISEMGSRGVGHVAWLCSITPPQVSCVVNVGLAHLGEFGSQDVIAQAKGEIVEALDDDGWAVLNADDLRVAAMASRTRGRVAWFSTGSPVPDAVLDNARIVVRASDITADELDRHSFTLSWHAPAGDGQASVRLPLLGAHLVTDAAAAVACAIAAGVDPRLAAKTLNTVVQRSRWRMELAERADGAVIINDAYNANPDSMAAALATLGRIAARRRATQPSARVIAILGDMLELGPDAERLHHDMGVLAANAGVDLVVAVGGLGRSIAEGARDEGVQAVEVPDAASALEHVEVRGGDVVLVKASRGMRLEAIASELIGGAVASGLIDNDAARVAREVRAQ